MRNKPLIVLLAWFVVLAWTARTVRADAPDLYAVDVQSVAQQEAHPGSATPVAGPLATTPPVGAARGALTSTAFELRRIAETGDAPPGRPNSAFQVFTDPSINNASQVAFEGRFTVSTGGADEGVFRFGGSSIDRIADNGFDQPLPPGEVTGNFNAFSSAVINNVGQVLFYGGTEFSDSEHGAYVFDGPGAGALILNDSMSQPVPGQPGASFIVFPFLNTERMLLSDSGHNAIIAQWRDAQFMPHSGLYHGSGDAATVRIADDTVAPPGQPGTVFSGPLVGNPPQPTNPFDPFMCMNNLGDVAFTGAFNFGAGSGMYRFDAATQTLVRIADTSMQPPGQPANARFSSIFNFPSMNATRTVAFKARYTGGLGDEGLYLGNGVGPLQVIVDKSGAFPVPEQPGTSWVAFEPPVINESGQVVFGAALTGGTAGGGLYIRSGGTISKIVDFADAPPGQPSATFNALDRFILNDRGHVVFRGRFTGNNFGIYFYDGQNVSRVIDGSQTAALLGTPYNRFSMLFGFGGSGGADGKARTLNESDEIVFRALINEFAEPQAIVLALPAEPCGVFDGDIEMVAVGNPQNPADTNGFGGVPDVFRIGLYEVTNAQYVEFLNAVAADDPNGLYEPVMTTSLRGGILRNGSPGSFTYALKPNFANKPANGFNWLSAARFCNWLHNGMPTGPQDATTTEDGAYDMSLPIDQITRKPGARFFIPTNDEWYKAAYHDPFDPAADASGTPDYWIYPTRSDVFPTQAIGDFDVGDVINPGPNAANYERGVDWNGTNCDDPAAVCGNVSTVGSAGAVSPWGAFDMAGNIYEWLENPGNTIAGDPPLPTRMARGGDFANSGVLMGRNIDIDVNMQAAAANFGLRVAARFNPCAGDLNCDNLVDQADADAFVVAALDPDAFRTSFQGCDISTADINGDGLINGADIQPLIELILGVSH